MFLNNDIKYRPFLSFTTLRIVALIIFGVAQISMALYIIFFTAVIPFDKLDSESANSIFDVLIGIFAEGNVSSTVSEYKLLVEFWPFIKSFYNISRLVPPLLIIGLFSSLIQNPDRLKRVFLKYLIATLLLFIFELFVYYFAIDGLFEAYTEDMNVSETMLELASTASKAGLRMYGNLNIFLDMLIAVIFFKFYMTSPKSNYFKKHLKLYRSFSILPIIYIIASTIIIGLEKLGKMNLPIAFNSLLSCRGIYVYLLFFSLCIYFRYRFKGAREDANYVEALNASNFEIFNFTVFTCSLLIFSTIVARLMSLNSTLVAFRLDYAKHYFTIIPLILFYNYTIRPRFKLVSQILYIIYYAFVFLILFIIYYYVFMYSINVLRILSSAF